MELRQQFKAICAVRGKNVQDEIIRFMNEEIEKAKSDPALKVLFYGNK